MTNYSDKVYKYLVWYNQDGCELTVIPFEDLCLNGNEYYDGKAKNMWGNFSLMFQDPWGDFKKIEVIGNAIDNPELLKG